MNEKIKVEKVNVRALPPARDPAPKKAYRRLAMHKGSPDWLPAGLFPELDRLRVEHHRHLRQVGVARAALAELDAESRKAEAAHGEALLEAHRRGEPVPADERLSPAERDAKREPLLANIDAAVIALAEHVERTIAFVREHEDEWLADLRERLPGVEAKRREAQRLVAEARAEEWTLDRLGRWLKGTSDDSVMGQQPAPSVDQLDGGVPPSVWRLDPQALTRHWSELRPWNARSEDDDKALREWRDGPQPQSPAPGRAPDGPIPSTVLPLSDDERFSRRGRGDAA